MYWEKLGLLFDPRQYLLPDECREFAQSPQVLKLPDRVRIYFSTRASDASGKYLSRIAYVEMTRDLRSVLKVNDHTVLPLGGLGTFDEHGIFPMNVLAVGDEVWGYTTGWNRRVSVSVDTAIGRVVSRDGGQRFEREADGPVLGPSLHEPFLVGDAFVRFIEDRYHMWYIFGIQWKRAAGDSEPDRTYKIGHATSTDGIHWVKDEARQIVANRLGEEECQALPTVVTFGNRHHMFFCYRKSFDFRTNRNNSYKIGHAWSNDLRHWTRNDDDPHMSMEPGGWDSEMQCYPHAFELDGEIILLYNGNEFGRAGFGAARLVRDRRKA